MRVELPADVDARELDPEVRRELRTLSKETADRTARHLVMTGRLLDEEPEQALAHARAARALAGRIGVVREAAGLAAYAAGEWSEALAELRAARRITGAPAHLAVLADCERALGRPERALSYADDPELGRLGQDERVELVIVVAGARRDLGQHDAAVLVLQDPARRTTARRPWAARLWYAYADALLEAGRGEQAREWFERAAEVDLDGGTDAVDRVLALDGVQLEDLGEDEPGEERADLPSDEELARFAREATGRGPRPEDDAGADDPPGSAGEASPPTLAAPASADVEPPSAEQGEPPASGVLPPPFAAPRDEELRLFE